MFIDDLHLDGADSGAITWGADIPDAVKADAPVVVIGCGEAGLLAGIRLKEAGLPFTIVEKNAGPGGTWWENRYPGARVDVGSHFYCYSFEPADHWTEYFSQQPELQDYFVNVMKHHGIDAHCRFETEVVARHVRRRHAAVGPSTCARADGATETARRAVRDQRGRRAEPAPARPTSRAWTTSPVRRSTPRAGTTSVDYRGQAIRAHRRGCQRLPDRADDRRRGRAARRVPAHRAVDVPEPELPPAGARRRQVGDAAPAVLRPLVPLPHLLSRAPV